MTEIRPTFTVDQRWFKARMKEKSLSLRALAKLIETDPSSLSRVLRGRQPIGVERAIGVSKAFDVPLEIVLKKVGVTVPVTVIPIVGVADQRLNITRQPPNPSVPPMASFPDLPLNTVSVVCTDHESTMSGWTFCYVPATDVLASAIGRLSLVTLIDGSEMIRFVRPSLQMGRFDLIPVIPKKPFPAVEIAAATPVLHIRP